LIVVARSRKLGGLYGPVTPRFSALRHEVARAFDIVSGNLSHGDSLRAAYNQDALALSREQREVARSILDPGNAGHEEIFSHEEWMQLEPGSHEIPDDNNPDDDYAPEHLRAEDRVRN
jgi:hypothetical protein